MTTAVASTHRQWLGRLFAALLAVGMLLVLMRLGFWQLERAHYKDALMGQFERNEMEPPDTPEAVLQGAPDGEWRFRKTRVSGRFTSGRHYLLDNRTWNGRAGYHVFSPFLSAGGTVMVNRGWMPVGDNRQVLPEVELDDGPLTVTGRLVGPSRSGLLLGSDGYEFGGWPRVVQRIDLARMSEQLETPLMPAILQLDADHPACEVCVWTPVAGIGPERHRGYAAQWFSLAAVLLILVAITGWLDWRRNHA